MKFKVGKIYYCKGLNYKGSFYIFKVTEPLNYEGYIKVKLLNNSYEINFTEIYSKSHVGRVYSKSHVGRNSEELKSKIAELLYE